MPPPPYDFSTFVSTSQFKLFGGNILQVPNYVGLAAQPGGDYQYGAIFSNFSSGALTWTNWIQPQIKNWQKRGINHVRCILGGDYVLQGLLTQAALNAAVNTIIADIRSRGMTVSFNMMAVNVLSDIGSPTAAAQWVVSKSILDNCIVPNQDVVAYFEPGNQESRSTDVAVEDAVCGLMKAGGYTCPIGVSPFGKNWTAYTVANIDLMCMHEYVAAASNYYEDLRSAVFTALSSLSGTKPLFLEETNILQNPAVQSEMANYLEDTLLAVYGQPGVVGYCVWGGQSISGQSDGDFGMWAVPGSYNPQAMDPTTDWQDLLSARVYASWGTPNRNQVFKISVNGTPTITTTLTAIQKNLTTPIQHNTLTNQDLGTYFPASTPASCVGSVSVTGDPSTTYRISFGATSFPGGVWVEIGHVDIVGSGSANINVSGTFGSGGQVPNIQTQIIAGSVNGTLTACNVTLMYGNAPALNPPRATPLVL